MLKERLEDVGRFGDIDCGDLGGVVGGLREAEHALKNRGSEAEDETVDVELFPIRGTQNSARAWGIEIV